MIELHDKQREAFSKLITTELPSLIREASTDINEYIHLEFEPYPILLVDSCTDEFGTDYIMVRSKCILSDRRTNETTEFNIDLLKLPVFQDLGFKVRGNYMQMLDSYDRTPGWHFVNKESEEINYAAAHSINNKKISFCYSKEQMYVDFNIILKQKKKIKVSVSTFFRALTGMSNEELLSKFGFTNPYVISAFSGNERKMPEVAKGFSVATRNDCITALLAAMIGVDKASQEELRSIKLKQKEIEKQLFNPLYFNFGKYNRERLEYLQSFQHRALNKTLARTVDVNGIYVEEGTVLSNQILQELDNIDLTEIIIKHDGKTFNIHKYAILTFRALNCYLDEDLPELNLYKGDLLNLDSLTVINSTEKRELRIVDRNKQHVCLTRETECEGMTMSSLFTAFDIWVNNLNGLEVYEQTYDLTNRVFVPFNVKAVNIVTNYLTYVIRDLKDNAYLSEAGSTMLPIISDYSPNINLNAFIDMIANPELSVGQITDMCNIMSFVSKNFKASFDMKAQVPDDLVKVQDLQNGRTDPFDVPESNKIALVYHRTMLSQLNQDGYITAPYLRVSNGKIVSDEPVYLTAIEESDKYIAEWCETFVNEDGTPKETVNARCNGDIVSTDVKNVSYKCFSPYQAMSIAHATLPFPGHSDGKRITMGCNQETQAVPMAHRNRPVVNAGGESLISYGFIYGYEVLDKFIESIRAMDSNFEQHEKEIRSSQIKLIRMQSEFERMTLYFKVLAMHNIHAESAEAAELPDIAEISYTHLAGSPELGLFTYIINNQVNNIYDPEDVVAYSNSCSMEQKEQVNLIDTGAHKIDESIFNKGLALVSNLRVGYKTWMGSTIDDAITISDECVYGDILTSIVLKEVTDVLYGDKNSPEHYGIIDNENYPYFNTNGLPKIGTYLNPGDPVISKIVKTKKGEGVHYKYLKMYQKGQVVAAKFVTKPGDKKANKTAVVILAERAETEVGDKYAGRCGNKGVVARIVPAEEMPFDPETGFRLQVLLNPLGVPSRQNISQFLDAALGYCRYLDGKMSVVSPYNPKDLEFVTTQMDEFDAHPKMLIDGRTGKYFERPINVGVLSMYKLHHMVNKKIHAIGMDVAVDPVFLQPRKGSKFDGGQSFGEMEAWCLECIGATKVLQDLYTIQSNDVVGKSVTRNDLEDGKVIKKGDGENHNDASLMAYYRSIGVEIIANQADMTYEFVPLTDSMMYNFSASPVTDKYSLHNASLFGGTSSIAEKDASRYKWSWINLKTKMIAPIWIEKGKLNSMILFKKKVRDGFVPSPLRKHMMNHFIDGLLYVIPEKTDNLVSEFTIAYKTEDVPRLGQALTKILVDLNSFDESTRDSAITGMSGLVYMFENADTKRTENVVALGIEAYLEKNGLTEFSPELAEDEKYLDMVHTLRMIHKFNQSEYGLSDYVISAFPILPQIYRPEFEGDALSVPAFDWHYKQIMAACDAVERNKTYLTEKNLYEKIKLFTGLKTDMKKGEAKYHNVSSYFGGKGRKSHGKIRTNVQSKRIVCSGRATIIPTALVKMLPTEIGVPITMLVKMYESQLIGYLKKLSLQPNSFLNSNKMAKLLMYIATKDFLSFNRVFGSITEALYDMEPRECFNWLTEKVVAYLEGDTEYGKNVVIAGRQPSLHKFSVRAYYPKVVWTKSINIHPLVCTGYNADFDGDQMWVAAIISEEAKMEAIEKMSPAVDCVNPKNNEIILSHSQDMALGIYCCTMLKDNQYSIDVNESDILHYRSIDELLTDLELELIKTYDVVCLTYTNGQKYISTAGRLLFNHVVRGFTEEPFTNTLGIPNLKESAYRELKYDGIVTKGKVVSGELRYFSLSDVCLNVYNDHASSFIQIFQDLTELGFRYSDKFGISLSLDDITLDSIRDAELEVGNKKKTEIERDYQDGLISEEDRKEAIISLFNNNKDGIHTKVKNDLISKISRNNNIFILLDSGARGSADQVMRMSGFLPQLQKDKTTTLETPIVHNFLEGLSEFDVHSTSYSVRTGLASTQNETPKAGYATHKVVFMTSGVEIVENDCGKTDWWYEVKWKDLRDDETRFSPTKKWFKDNFVGKVIAEDDIEACQIFGVDESRVITEQCFINLNIMEGIHSVRFEDGSSYQFNISDARNKVLDLSDQRSLKVLYGHLDDNHRITSKCIADIQRMHLMQVSTLDGTFYFKYTMDDCSRSLLLHRVARNLPHLKRVFDTTSGKFVEVITEETIKEIERQNMQQIEARILLDCKSKHGVCAHCYGLLFSKMQLPKVGEFVGTEAAQAIGEPSAQLTISLVNKGGSAGASINSGVAQFNKLLEGTKNPKEAIFVAQYSGYVHLNKVDKNSTVIVEPANKQCTMCEMCTKGTFNCPMKTPNAELACQLPRMIETSSLVVKDGDWISAGDPLTNNLVIPDFIQQTCIQISNSFIDTKEIKYLLRKKQMVWLENYFNTFLENSITINARHFEILARIQNLYCTVVGSKDSRFNVGEIYELPELLEAGDNVIFNMALNKRDDVTMRTSGPLASLAFERLAEVAAKLTCNNIKGSVKHNNSLIGAVSIGADLRTGQIKNLKSKKVPNFVQFTEPKQKKQQFVDFSQALQALEESKEFSIPEQQEFDFDFDALQAELDQLNGIATIVENTVDTSSETQFELENTYSNMEDERDNSENEISRITAFPQEQTEKDAFNLSALAEEIASNFLDDNDNEFYEEESDKMSYREDAKKEDSEMEDVLTSKIEKVKAF